MPQLRYYSVCDEWIARIERVATGHGVRLVPEIPILGFCPVFAAS